ncbi:hypothetical protein [Roseibacillus ishigakijimensis]|uniref:Uncharacterized protein n=1 Tax=Roseibacillus ishigakijimensis TaxID=454146 RepID=A0A934RL43_9BACT|nr:hypothetical protein [Roseibacillus ishigakijimensis]MBK1833707.1 hypothetical protein [Roseibacillus ishigakijimensis]
MILDLPQLLLLLFPLGFAVAVFRVTGIWPLTYVTVGGAALSAINLRAAATLAEQAQPGGGAPYHVAVWIFCPLILATGLVRINRLRKANALSELLAEEEKEKVTSNND